MLEYMLFSLLKMAAPKWPFYFMVARWFVLFLAEKAGHLPKVVG